MALTDWLPSNLRGTLGTIFRIGPGAAATQLKNNGGVLEARNSTDAGFVVVRGAPPVGVSDLTQKQYVDAAVAAVTATGPAGGDLAGTYPNPTVKSVTNGFAILGDISPATLSANQHNWSPTGLSTASTIRVTSSIAIDITGLQGGTDGRIIVIENIGSNIITLKSQSGSSTAANRFAIYLDTPIPARGGAILRYDSIESRWYLIGSSLYAPGAPGTMASFQQVVGTTVNPITSSMTFVSLAQMSITFTPVLAVNNVRVAFSGIFIGSTNNAVATTAIFLDGVEVPNTQRSGGGGNNITVATEKWLQNLSQTSHTIEVRWLTSQGTVTATDVHRIFSITEFSA